ncbi:tRNA-dihydrouridine(16/17) synthase [NAD(P)(+)]-like isoform X1 [Acropora palmata]|uniref:tRNA-dihydrouridine(16/17) synthase [NAD(P)(+)]-like isoform X1 n=1 Tax=Acropora palmata TaxID=6131 RepID=UPI003DA1646B
MSKLKILSSCKYIASPFSNLEDLSWRLLLRKLGVHLCFNTSLIKANFEGLDNVSSLFGNQEDRPLVVQVSSEDPDSVVATVNELQDLCDAVDIDQCNSSCDDKNDAWNAWITCIEKVQRDCKIPIFCKLPFSWQTVDETVRKGKLLQEAGCKFLLLHKQRKEKLNAIVTNKDWDAVKIICESVSLPFILDVGTLSLWEIDKCIQHTGVQGVAVSDSLETNPALFSKKQPTILEVVDNYLELCEMYHTPLLNVKQHLQGFCYFYLCRFHGINTKLEEVKNIEEIKMLIDELKREMAMLSQREMKSLVRLKRKKETFKRKHLEKTEEKKFTKELHALKCNEDVNHVPKIIRKKIQKERVENAMKNGAQRVAIDFTLSEDMNNKEVSKLAAQLRQLYGSNMKSVSPVDLHLTGLETNGRVYRECVRQSLNFDKLMVHKSETSYCRLFDPEEIVYLTPDSPQVLETLDKDKVYIIGGLVDHHVLKDRTKSRAETKRVSTARLPIDVYMERKSEPGNHSFSKVLTVNQVFDILLKFHETQDWRCALESSIPSRKGLVLKQP